MGIFKSVLIKSGGKEVMKRKVFISLVLLFILCGCIWVGMNAQATDESFYNTWRVGNYTISNGKYEESSNRISYYDYVYVNGLDTLSVNISDSNYHVLLRELDENQKFVKSSELQSSTEYIVQQNTRFVGVTVYSPLNWNMNYEEYHNAFSNGLNISVSKMEGQEENVEQPEEIIVQDTFYDVWRNGNYSGNDGAYEPTYNRISYMDYLAVTPGANVTVEISNPIYHVLIRELNESNKVIRSYDLKDSTNLTMNESTFKVAVTVYCPSNWNITYEDYHNAFLKGLIINVTANNGIKDDVEEIVQPPVAENPVEEEIEPSDDENMNDVVVDTSIDQAVSDSLLPSGNAMDFANKMGAGWNLGNALLCCNGNVYSPSTAGTYTPRYYETLWGNLYTTQSMITAVKNAGFNTVRIPVTYRNHIDGNYQIDPVWLARVKEVVDYVVSQNMYCIIDLHHENWLVADTSCQDAASRELAALWTQIATYFAAYDEHLIFEGFNEVINSKGQWDSADTASYQAVNLYNQTFVNAVRATGGNNANRYLLVNTYAAKATQPVVSGFVLPTDTVMNHLLVGVHVYDGIGNIPSIMSRLNSEFVSKGVPVVIGEWGLVNNSSNTTSVRVNYVKQYLTEAKKYGIVCVWWDDGCGGNTSASSVSNYSLLCRKNATWYFPEIVNAITSFYK